MIEQFYRPESVQQALELKRQFLDEAVYFGGGSKLNATPTKTEKKIAIALTQLGLDQLSWQQGALHIGVTIPLQKLIDSTLTPPALREALGFVYSRHIRNQATLGGEIAAAPKDSVLLPVLLALSAKVVIGDGNTLELGDYLAGAQQELLLELVLPDPYRRCATHKVARSAAGLAVLTAAVSCDAQQKVRIALSGVVARPSRLRDAEQMGLSGPALEKVVAEAVAPEADLCGSVAYKRYISGVVVADLLASCQASGGVQ
ncbi:molybdopterin-dependent oxidoreductase FAD-binding subunit [Serratia oryzae]|jgi:putative selenate reductase FAD-binding subunit|uniref:Molybdopterin-dependent oxidoreductase FAD-binding subunit n=1 Tax=Serratia oryzae TaxID=2034155 RepID=A0A1S8CKB0_9GAMM|nr:molybdopterin-dependent oxidoreductase FAD-binding subunit [Serratia oryzae]OMQ22857.1 molybdopterin-dependent oxidoreductase FAD-binding subunit [Serratia oryzae]VXC70441.1 putative oxidoreductase [Enterobacterales bacterium 8AC]